MKKVSLVLIVIVLVGVSGLVLSRRTRTSNNSENGCIKVPVTSDAEIQPIKELFDSSEPPEGEEFYMLSTETNPWTAISFDVDGDGKPEEILTAKIAMNHTPHVLRIVKDEFVVFKHEGVGVYAKETEDNDGFILGETIDWNEGIRRQTRYDHESGRFLPLWYQDNCDSQL